MMVMIIMVILLLGIIVLGVLIFMIEFSHNTSKMDDYIHRLQGNCDFPPTTNTTTINKPTHAVDVETTALRRPPHGVFRDGAVV